MALSSPRFNRDPQVVKAAENNPPLKQGSRGEGVKILQMALIDLGFRMPNSTAGETLLPDGIFGTETASVVRAFQQRHGLSVDGVAGRQTLGALESQCIALTAVVTAKQSAEGRRNQMLA